MKAKQLFLSAVFLTISFVANAQWVQNGSTVYTYGKVGIGASNPSVDLRVSGTTEIDNLTLNNTMGRHLFSSTYQFIYKGVTVPSYSFCWSDKDIYASSGYTLWVSSNYGMKFFTGKAPRLTIDPNGNVGIGTETPTHKLAVNGTIKAREVLVTTADWADFVFESDYKLPSLDEVQYHIKENGHLPGIPSAKEVQENGIGLAEMNVKLLQKIEEQTLYILELNNRIQQFEKKLQSIGEE